MNILSRRSVLTLKKTLAVSLIVWMTLLSPVAVFAQEAVDAAGTPTGAPADTGAPECTGAGCGQGADQGIDQGTEQGGQSAEELGADAEGNLPAGTVDTRQGANQGAAAGSSNGVEASNENTGANSDNQNDVAATNSTTTGIDNTATDTTNATATGTTGGNTNSANTGNTGVTTGAAGIGVTQVKNDNTATIGGTAGLNVTGYQGDHQGDLNLDFGMATALLSGGGSNSSVRAINDTTGANSTNGNDIATRTEELNEVQNDGTIDNILNLAAITGQNTSDKNTGDAAIATGDANVAATLVNLLNTTVINGDLWITVADIFGDLEGNINIPDLSSWLASYAASNGLVIDALNENTGSDSNNAIDIAVSDDETTRINNNADITTTVNASAITGQNDAIANTGGSAIATGDGQVSASNISVANTTIEGGNWGLFIVNALNGWLGFLVGDSGEVRALSQEETLREIAAQNSSTGADSDNTITVTDETERTTTVDNDAAINNEITASAITGQNATNKNTGMGQIETGDATVQATTVNIANTTVKDGSLFIAVVNIFGDWFGDLLYGGKSLAAAAANSAATTVDINAANEHTGSDSTNTIDVAYDKSHETTITNDADLLTTLNANIDTGSNRANRNTMGAAITTGDGLLALHSRAAANLVGIGGNGGVAVTLDGSNDTTGSDSTNRINATINNDRLITVSNDANVDTIIGSLRQPALINTGNNAANENTMGATIITGDAAAEVAIENLVNQVILALTGQGIDVTADFTNRLTGALSDNSNGLVVDDSLRLDVLNVAFINNLINLLLNTGGNTANENTGGGFISTGEGCVDITLRNTVNRATLSASGGTTAAVDASNLRTGFDSNNTNGVTTNESTTATVDNTATVNNAGAVDVTTGNNENNRNTARTSGDDATGECEKLAQAPVPSPSPTPTPNNPGDEPGEEEDDGDDEGRDGQGGDGGEIADAHEERAPRIAGEKHQPVKRAMGGNLLKRFPVAGGEDVAALLQGKEPIPWYLFLVLSVAMVGLAWHYDQRSAVAGSARNSQ